MPLALFEQALQVENVSAPLLVHPLQYPGPAFCRLRDVRLGGVQNAVHYICGVRYRLALSRPLAGFSEHATVVEFCVVSHHHNDAETTSGKSNRRMVPAFSDGPRSLSLAWGNPVDNLDPAAARSLRVLGSKLWLD